MAEFIRPQMIYIYIYCFFMKLETQKSTMTKIHYFGTPMYFLCEVICPNDSVVFFSTTQPRCLPKMLAFCIPP